LTTFSPAGMPELSDVAPERALPLSRLIAWMLTVLVVAGAALFAGPATSPALAACGATTPQDCLPTTVTSAVDCLDPPTPAMPDTGASSFFLSTPDNQERVGQASGSSTYSQYGYAGIQYHTYDLGCGPDGAVAPDALVNTSIANMMLSISTFLVGATNSVREHAYDPKEMWGWTDGLVQDASRSLYERLFTVLGAVSLVLVGAWLMWSARRGELSSAATTAGWAILVMVITTAIAAWPLRAATVADSTLVGSLGVVSDALHPTENQSCGRFDCKDAESPQVRASGVLVDVTLYNQWLSGELGSSSSKTAKDYGDKLYEASAFTWAEAQKARTDPSYRASTAKRKQADWKRYAAEIKQKDPDAYEYLTGKQGSSRIGSAFTALIAALVSIPFDMMSSLLIIIAFLIIRLAVAFLPALAVIGILRPASGPLRGLFRTVVAAILNCIIFGVGASVYLLALELITNTKALAGWQQILLIFLTGVVMWMLLRPFRRITSLAGHSPFGDLLGGIGEMRRRAFGDLRTAGATAAGTYLGNRRAAEDEAEASGEEGRRTGRPESWTRTGGVLRSPDAPLDSPVPRTAEASERGDARPSTTSPPYRRESERTPMQGRYGGSRPESGGGVGYLDPDYAVSTRGEVLPVETNESYVIYRPDRGLQTVGPRQPPPSRPEANSSARLGMAAASVASAASAVRDLADTHPSAPIQASGRRPD
jgi:hypothetical protein